MPRRDNKESRSKPAEACLCGRSIPAPQHRWSRSITAEWANQRRRGASGGRRFSVQRHAKGMLMELLSVRVCPRGIAAVVFFTDDSRRDRETTSVDSCGIKWSRRTRVIFLYFICRPQAATSRCFLFVASNSFVFVFLQRTFAKTTC